jgi:hypothetical protein
MLSFKAGLTSVAPNPFVTNAKKDQNRGAVFMGISGCATESLKGGLKKCVNQRRKGQ